MLKRSFFICTSIAMLCILLLALPSSAASVPLNKSVLKFSIMGNWSGTSVGYTNSSGYLSVDTPTIMSIEELRGRIFSGTLYTTDEKGLPKSKRFAGVIGADGNEFIMAEFDTGLTFGRIVNKNQIECSYFVDGPDGMVFMDSFTRMPILKSSINTGI